MSGIMINLDDAQVDQPCSHGCWTLVVDYKTRGTAEKESDQNVSALPQNKIENSLKLMQPSAGSTDDVILHFQRDTHHKTA